jgi:hypothetical protein
VDIKEPGGPLVDPFPWQQPARSDRTVDRWRFSQMAERFAVAEDLIRLHDIARLWYRLGLEPSAKWSVDLLELERRFDELAPRTIRGIDTVDLPDWDLVSPEPEPVGQGER